MSNIIEPHGGKGLTACLLEGAELAAEKEKAASLKKVNISPLVKSDLTMIGIGGFSPLTGFMTRADWLGVCENFLLSDGTFWPVPINLDVTLDEAASINERDEIALYDPEFDEIMATMKISEKWIKSDIDKTFECEKIYMGEGTPTAEEFWEIALWDHPGVQVVMGQGPVNLAGPVKVISEGQYPAKFAGIYHRPTETRKIFEEYGWSEVAAFQLEDRMLRSHEYLCKIAVEVCDGIYIQYKIGGLKPGDIPADVQFKCIDALIKNYFVEKTVIQGGHTLNLRYAGPREGLLHAVFYQNYGCSRIIISRDYAGVGDFYGMFEAQNVFNHIPFPKGEGKGLKCTPMKIDWTFYCYKCDGMASLKTCPHDKEDRVSLSRTMHRKMLSEGNESPKHYSRNEVEAILQDYFENLTEKVEIKIHKAACAGEEVSIIESMVPENGYNSYFRYRESTLPDVRVPKRYFASRIEGGPEVSGKHPKLLLGKRYNCVFGINSEAYTNGFSLEISPEVLVKMRDRDLQVMVVGHNVEIRNSCIPLQIHQNFTSAEAAVNFNAIEPGPCNLQLRLLLDCNFVSNIKYDFVAVQHIGSIANAPPAEQKIDLGPVEYFDLFRKNEMNILVNRLGSKLELNVAWLNSKNEKLTFLDQTRIDVNTAIREFLSSYNNKKDYIVPVKLVEKNKKEFMAELKRVGDIIFNRLFIQGGTPKLGKEIRNILRSNCPVPIQIQTSDEYLPWMFISDGVGALGLRHSVEHVLVSDGLRDAPLEFTKKPIRMVCGMAPVLKSEKLEDGRSVIEIQEEAKMMLTGDRFDVSFVYDEEQWLQELSSPADVIYAYCHGGMGIGSIPDPYIWMTSKGKKITGTTIANSETIDWSNSPLVILAACTSGAIDPFRAVAMSKNFLAKGIRGYIATEGKVPTTFASLFMKKLIEEFFVEGGKQLGDVLFGLRNLFLSEMNNPWGILLTQFCPSELTVRNY
jgi:sulfate adenylyltransferase